MSEGNGNGQAGGNHVNGRELYPFLDTIAHPKKRAFLLAYCETCNIVQAALLSGVPRSSHYSWKNADDDYAEAFSRAQPIAAELLEARMTDRALNGLKRYKFFKGDPIRMPCPGDHPEAIELLDSEQKSTGVFFWHYYEVDYPETTAIFLLKGAMPEKYRERYEVRVSDEELDSVIEGQMEVLAKRQEAIAAQRGQQALGDSGHSDTPPEAT